MAKKQVRRIGSSDKIILAFIKSGYFIVDLLTGHMMKNNGKPWVEQINSNSLYFNIQFFIKSKHYTMNVHRIIALAAYGLPTKPNVYVMHINNRKTDNRALNLKFVSAKEIYERKEKRRVKPIKPELLNEIKKMHEDGMSSSQVHKIINLKYGLTIKYSHILYLASKGFPASVYYQQRDKVDIEELKILLYKEGFALTTIAKKIGVRVKVLQDLMYENKMSYYSKQSERMNSPKVAKKIRILYNEKFLSVSKIAKQLEMPIFIITGIMKLNGIERISVNDRINNIFSTDELITLASDEIVRKKERQ